MKNKKHAFKKTNLQWFVDYDYERTACHCNEDYCRCTKIINAHVCDVDVKDVMEALRNNYQIGSYIDEYCFDRICYAFKIYDINLYEVEVGGGYYGEEVYGVEFENEEKIYNAYHELLALNTDIEKIKYCLNLEYGYLIDCVESASSVNIIEASPNEIHTPQMEYFRRVDKNIIDEYKDRHLPIAVCVRDGEKYKLVDGYHRFVANKNNETVDIVVLE